VQPDVRSSDIIFADARGVKCTLHAYPEQPFCVRGREFIVFRKYMKINGEEEGSDNESGADLDTLSRTTRTGQDHDNGAVFVSK
jgi:hypothetical protein